MNEIADRIEHVLMAAARRRSARRHRRMVLAAALATVLLLVSGASAVTGVGLLGDALTADEKLPPGAKPDPRGDSVLLVAKGEDGRRYEVRAYRQKSKDAGARYCIASYSANSRGRRDPIIIVCTGGGEIAAKLARRPVWLDCSSRGGVVGVPAPGDPVCGLTRASTRAVRIEPNTGSAGAVKLSRPFSLRYGGKAIRVRAVLGVVEAPPTQPGKHTPRVKVTAIDEDGSRFTTHVGGRRVLTTEQFPPHDPRPEPGGPEARVAAMGPGGVLWTAHNWRGRVGALCASAVPEGMPEPPLRDMYMVGKPQVSSCIESNELGRFRSIVRDGAAGSIAKAPVDLTGGGKAVYGVARADLRGLAVRDRTGRLWRAVLSRPWTTWRRRPNDLVVVLPRYRHRFAGLPRQVRLRAFLAVIPADVAAHSPVRLRFEARR